MAGFGGAVKLTGESEYRRALNQITQNLKEVSSELKVVSSSFSSTDKSEQALAARTQVLNKQLTEQTSKLSLLKSQYSSMSAQYATQTSKHNALVASYDKEKSKLDQIKSTLGTTSSEYKSQAAKVAELEKAVEKSATAQDKNAQTMSKMRMEINNAQADINKTKTEMKGLGDETEKAGDKAEKASNGGFTVLKGVLSNLASQAISSAVSGLKNLASNVVAVGSGFESSMQNVAALSGATGDELAKLEETARHFGATTQFSASEAADALGYMALAGWDTQQSMDGLPGILNLAAASGMGLAEASDMCTDYLSAFSMGAEESAYFADMLAYAQANSNTTAQGLGQAFRNCAANMNAAGQDVETTTSLLAMLANQGLKGSEAGTALTAMMRDMTSRMKDGAIAIGDTSVQVMDANGNYRDMTDILTDVEAATQGMGDAERATALQATFTADSIKGMNLILNAGVGEAANFEESLRSCSGSAEQMAQVMNDTLSGDLKTLNSAWEELNLVIYESANGPLREIIQAVTNELIPALTDLVNGVDGAGAALGESIGNILNNIISMITSALPTLVEMGVSLIASLAEGVLSNLPAILDAGIDALLALMDGISKTVPKLIEMLPTIIAKMCETLISRLPQIITTGIDMLVALINGIVKAIPQLVNAMPQIISAIVNTLMNNLPQIISAGVQLLVALINGIVQSLPQLISMTPRIIMTLVQTLTQNLPQIMTMGVKILSSLIQGVVSMLGNLGSTAGQIVSTIAKSITELPGKALQWGKDLIQGLINGITGMIGAVGDAIGSIASKITSFLHFSRPDEGPLREYEEWMPDFIGGMSESLKAASPKLINQVKALSGGMSDAFSVDGNLSGSRAGGSYGVNSDMIAAFKEALYQVKIELDDEVAGRFVDKTVTRLVYS